MSVETTQLLAAFNHLPAPDKQEFLAELFRQLPPYDSGPLDEALVARAGDDLAALLNEEENEAAAG